jgi:CheY-like chemotaxis protein
LVFIDQQLTDMDGFKLARTMRDDTCLAGARVVLLGPIQTFARQPQSDLVDITLTKPVRETRLQKWLHETFGAKLKETAKPDRPDAIRPPAAVPPDSLRILVVEDSHVNQRVALLHLERLGFTADLAANGAEALKLLEHKPYNVIFMDCQMPVMDGLRATVEIRRQKLGDPNVRIIAMTASAMEGDREKCLAVGMDDYISKPVQVEDLLRVLSARPGPHTSESIPRQPPPIPST